jgi:hypothetical protein
VLPPVPSNPPSGLFWGRKAREKVDQALGTVVIASRSVERDLRLEFATRCSRLVKMRQSSGKRCQVVCPSGSGSFKRAAGKLARAALGSVRLAR